MENTNGKLPRKQKSLKELDKELAAKLSAKIEARRIIIHDKLLRYELLKNGIYISDSGK